VRWQIQRKPLALSDDVERERVFFVARSGGRLRVSISLLIHVFFSRHDSYHVYLITLNSILLVATF
jgi:hypothetical protein